MIAAWCSRCGRPAPVDPDELTGDGGGDPALLPVVVPPDGYIRGWIGDPDSEGVVCGDCAEPWEIAAFWDDLDLLEQLVADG